MATSETDCVRSNPTKWQPEVVLWYGTQRRPASTAALPAGFPPSASSRMPGRRSDTFTPASTSSPRAPIPPVSKFHGTMPATGACASSAAPLSQGTGACVLCAAPPTTGACAWGTAPLSLGTGARVPSAPLSSHAPRNSQTAAPGCRSFRQGCPPPPPPGHAMAVGFEVRGGRLRNPEILGAARLGVS